MIKEGTIPEVVRSLQRAKAEALSQNRPLARAIFFTGAGCSRSAGVPLAAEIAQSLAPQLADTYDILKTDSADEAIAALMSADHFANCMTDGKVDWYKVYDECFAEHYRTPDHARSIFKRAIEGSYTGINWAHLCIGELVARSYCSTVITTNFDLMALEGMVLGGVIPIVCDGLESLVRISGNPDHPQLLQLNGSIHSYILRNRPDEIAALSSHSGAISCFRDLIRNADVIVFVGYAGREAAIMGLLRSAMSEFSQKEVFWCLYSDSASALSSDSVALMEGNPNARVILNQDADLFFYELCRDLGVGAPGFIRNPLNSVRGKAKKISLPQGSGRASEIREEIARFERKLDHLSSINLTEGFDRQSILLDQASDERFKGDDRAALATLEPLLSDPNCQLDVLKFATEIANNIASATFDQRDIDRACDLSLRVLEATSHLPIDQRLDVEILRAESLDTRGMGKSSLEDTKAALVHYERVAEQMGDDFDIDIWLVVKNKVGWINSRMGEILDADQHVEKAIEAYDDILNRITRDERPVLYAQMLSNKAVSVLTLGELRQDVDILRKSIELQEEAAKDLSKETEPRPWIVHSLGVASAYGIISLLEGDLESARKSMSINKEVFEVCPDDDHELKAGVTMNLGKSILRVAALTEDVGLVREAEGLLERASRAFEDLQMDYQVSNAALELANCHDILKELESA